jgi:hypothetical protein
MAGRSLIPLLVTMMLVTGVCNTILNKFQVCARPLHRAPQANADQRTCNVYGTATRPTSMSGSCSSSRLSRRMCILHGWLRKGTGDGTRRQTDLSLLVQGADVRR